MQKNEDNFLKIIPLGAGNEVGRSCIFLSYKGKKILFDCGLHPAPNLRGLSSLPFLDSIDIDGVDLLLVTHFHLDHCGAVPYVIKKTKFSGDIYMTHATKAIYKLVLNDNVNVVNVGGENEILYDSKDVKNSMAKIKPIVYHREYEKNGIKFKCFNAGHVLGAAMFLVEIDGVKILYTGDYSRENERILRPAEIPNEDVDVLIVESTYGIQVHENRNEREFRFTKSVHEIVSRGGKCLLPVFVLGRAQEILLILEEYWTKHNELNGIPIKFSSPLASKCLNVFDTNTGIMSSYVKNIKEMGLNPFDFKHVKEVRDLENNDDPGAQVAMASPGMLQDGLSRKLFEKWCQEPKNGVVFTGYSSKGTLAHQLLNRPMQLEIDKKLYNLKMSIENISFSAHCDYNQTSEYVRQVHPRHIVLVHGEEKEMASLKKKMETDYKGKINIYNPKNTESVNLSIQLESHSIAHIIGSLCKEVDSLPSHMESSDVENVEEEEKDSNNFITVSGMILKSDQSILLMSPKDIPEFTNFKQYQVKQSIKVNFDHNFKLLTQIIAIYFSGFNASEELKQISLSQGITIKQFEMEKYVSVDWVSSTYNDFLADNICLTLMNPDYCIALIATNEVNTNKKYDKLVSIIKEKYKITDMSLKSDQIVMLLQNDKSIIVHTDNGLIECNDPAIAEEVNLIYKEIDSIYGTMFK